MSIRIFLVSFVDGLGIAVQIFLSRSSRLRILNHRLRIEVKMLLSRVQIFLVEFGIPVLGDREVTGAERDDPAVSLVGELAEDVVGLDQLGQVRLYMAAHGVQDGVGRCVADG